MNPARKAYERYRLEWMLAQGKTLPDMIREMENARQDNDNESVEQIFNDWEHDFGFGGSIWPCFDEFITQDLPLLLGTDGYPPVGYDPEIHELELGTFQITSDKMTVSDPCYDEDVWCKNDLTNVLPGTWRATVYQSDEGEWGQRMSILSAVHEDYADDNNLTRSEAPFSVAVDSGQAGLFDAAHYRDSTIIPGYGEIKEEEPSELWYNHCCEMTLSRIGAGTMPYGVVSTSGYGDGCYGCYIYTNDSGWIVKVEIEFISEDEDE